MAGDGALLEHQHMRLKQCRFGPMLYNVTDTYIGRSLDLYGEFSFAETRFFEQILHPGMLAIDVGANIGCHTVFMAQRVGPGGAVIAIEPQRVVFQTLCANLSLNAIENVRALNAAAGAEAGTIVVPNIEYGAGGNFGGVELGGYESGEQVPLMAIDSLPVPSCHLIKIDVEGMETEVLKGAHQTIARCQPALYVENDRRDRSPELIETLLSAGYKMFWHAPRLYNPENFFRNTDNVFGDMVSLNLLCLPKALEKNVSGLTEITSPSDWPA